jgi:hypothetical protein
VDTERRRVEAAQTTLTTEQALVLMSALGSAIREEVHDQRVLGAIARKFAVLMRRAGVNVAVPGAAGDA